MQILRLDSVSISYQTEEKQLDVVSEISFSINEGEFVSLIGPSGCGKSTILSAISGLTSIDKGKIEITSKQDELASVGYMLQRDCLFPFRTIEENVYLGLEIKGILTEENKNYALSLIDKYGLAEFKNSYPEELSGGMRQRVALIRTLATKPTLLLLDEAFSALDYQTRLHVSSDIANIIKSEKMTALLVTHDISEAISLSDRVVVFSKRPAKLKSIYEINFEGERGTKTREDKKFGGYFNDIWRDIDEHI